MQIDGACHCGHLSYEAELDPEQVGVCHCTDCQTLSGSAFSTFAQVPKGAFRMRAGEPRIYVKVAESGNRRAQWFCGECGTRIYASADHEPQFFNLRVGTIRQRAELPPRVQIWCRSALPWVTDLPSVRQLPTQSQA